MKEFELKNEEFINLSKILIETNIHEKIINNIKSLIQEKIELTVLLLLFLVEDNNIIQEYFIKKNVNFI